MTLNILIVGCGSIGRRHAANLRALADEGRAELDIAVCDSDASAAEALACSLNVRVVEQLETALTSGGFDACIICTPNHLHYQHALAALNAGVAVFLEKPVATSSEEAGRLADACDACGGRVMVGCNLRFHPAIETLQQCLQQGRIGRVLYARAVFAHALPNWRPGVDYRMTYSAIHAQGGGILLDAIHEPDYLAHLLGRPAFINGWAARSGNLDIDAEDMAAYVLRHETGGFSFVHVDYLRQDKFRSCEIIGETGTLIWESRGKAPEKVIVSCYSSANGNWEQILELEDYTQNDQYVNEMKFFIEAVRTGAPLINGPREASRILACIEAVRPKAPLTAKAPYERKAPSNV